MKIDVAIQLVLIGVMLVFLVWLFYIGLVVNEPWWVACLNETRAQAPVCKQYDWLLGK